MLVPDIDRLPLPEFVSEFAPVKSTAALPLLAVPESPAVPVIDREPLPELAADALPKRVPSVDPDPLVVVVAPLTVTLPLVTLKVDDVPNTVPVPVFETPAKETFPETLVVSLAKNSRPR